MSNTLADIFGNEMVFKQEYLCYDDRNGHTYISTGVFVGFTKTKLATIVLTNRVKVWKDGSMDAMEFKPKQTISVKSFKLIPNIKIIKQNG